MNSHLLQVQELCQHSHPGAACPQLSHLAVAGGDPQALLFTATNSTGPKIFFFLQKTSLTDSSTHPDRSAQAAEDAFHPYRTDCLRQKIKPADTCRRVTAPCDQHRHSEQGIFRISARHTAQERHKHLRARRQPLGTTTNPTTPRLSRAQHRKHPHLLRFSLPKQKSSTRGAPQNTPQQLFPVI